MAAIQLNSTPVITCDHPFILTCNHPALCQFEIKRRLLLLLILHKIDARLHKDTMRIQGQLLRVGLYTFRGFSGMQAMLVDPHVNSAAAIEQQIIFKTGLNTGHTSQLQSQAHHRKSSKAPLES